MARLGYLVDLTIRYGLFPALEIMALDPAGRANIERGFHRPAEVFCARIAEIRWFVLDHVEETRALMK